MSWQKQTHELDMAELRAQNAAFGKKLRDMNLPYAKLDNAKLEQCWRTRGVLDATVAAAVPTAARLDLVQNSTRTCVSCVSPYGVSVFEVYGPASSFSYQAGGCRRGVLKVALARCNPLGRSLGNGPDQFCLICSSLKAMPFDHICTE